MSAFKNLTYGAQRGGDVIDDVSRFLSYHRARLLRYLDGIAPEGSDEPDALKYIGEVLVEWSRLPDDAKRVPPDRVERTFWYALYSLEELVENPPSGGLDPYEAVLLEDLATARELLRQGNELPAGHHATRPGELDLEDDAPYGDQ